MDIDQKIDSAITECMRLGRHASRTAMVPLPFSGIIGTPTVAHIMCTNVLQCFGFPNVQSQVVTEIMQRIVFENLSKFAAISAGYFVGVGGVTTIATLFGGPAGAVTALIGCLLATPPTARMLLRCGCDVILILERAFSYGGRYVTEKQIESAANHYVSQIVREGSNAQTSQMIVHHQVDNLIPLVQFGIPVGVKFGKLRAGMTDIIHWNSCREKDDEGRPKNSSDLLRTSGETLRNSGNILYKEVESIKLG